MIKFIHYPHRGFRVLHSKYIFSKILEAIENIHKAGICHRDLKLSNILVDIILILKFVISVLQQKMIIY